MKKHVAFLLCLSMILCLTACGKAPATGNEPTSIPSSEFATASNVDGGSLAYTAKVAYANASGDIRLLSAALNADLMYISSVQHWPVYKFETEGELQNFQPTLADALTFDHG